jgi:1,2-diacylglycerol 3-beta-galactosyltransferase
MSGFLHMLNHAGLPLQLAIVAGGDDALYAELQETEWHGQVHLYNFVETMPALMHASDLILCKAGGLIVTEALACGLPLLLIDVLPGQEEGNAEYVLAHGAGELAETPMDALAILYHWLEDGGRLLAERAEKARQIGRPEAAYDIAERVWHAGEELRAEQADQAEERSKLGELLSRYDVPWRS